MAKARRSPFASAERFLGFPRGGSAVFPAGGGGGDDDLPDLAEADSLYQQAEDILLEDMPIIPIMYGLTHTVHTDRVSNIEVDPRTFVRVEQIQVNE